MLQLTCGLRIVPWLWAFVCRLHDHKGRDRALLQFLYSLSTSPSVARMLFCLPLVSALEFVPHSWDDNALRICLPCPLFRNWACTRAELRSNELLHSLKAPLLNLKAQKGTWRTPRNSCQLGISRKLKLFSCVSQLIGCCWMLCIVGFSRSKGRKFGNQTVPWGVDYLFVWVQAQFYRVVWKTIADQCEAVPNLLTHTDTFPQLLQGSSQHIPLLPLFLAVIMSRNSTASKEMPRKSETQKRHGFFRKVFGRNGKESRSPAKTTTLPKTPFSAPVSPPSTTPSAPPLAASPSRSFLPINPVTPSKDANTIQTTLETLPSNSTATEPLQPLTFHSGPPVPNSPLSLWSTIQSSKLR